MVAVQEALEDLGGGHKSLEDDRLVYEIAQRLPKIFRGDLFNPVYPGQGVVLNDWSDEDRAAVVGSAKVLADHMESALKRSADGTLVVNALRRAFGERIPYRPDAVEILPPKTAGVVKATPATVAAPKVGRSTSG
jgi:hypothetical protein